MKIKLDKTIESMDSMALSCRATGFHPWKRVFESRDGKSQTVVHKGKLRQLEVVMVCETCDSERIDVYSLPSFILVRRKYNYNPDYKLPKGEAARPRSAYRAAYFMRELKELFE